jgi:hypothetical protein
MKKMKWRVISLTAGRNKKKKKKKFYYNRRRGFENEEDEMASHFADSRQK